MPSLDPRYFPHIFEEVLRQADRKTMYNARLVSKAMCDVADAALLDRHRLRFWTDVKGDLIATSSRGRLPFFHPESRTFSQRRAMWRAREIWCRTASLAPRFADLTEHVNPRCRLELRHSGQLQNDIVIRSPGPLKIDINLGCSCREESMSVIFRHTSSRVVLNIGWYIPSVTSQEPTTYGRHQRHHGCTILDGLINPGVEELVIIGNVMLASRLFEKAELRTSPKLVISVHLDPCSPSAQFDLRGSLAKRFSLPQHRVRFTDEPYYPFIAAVRAGLKASGAVVKQSA